MESSQRTTKTKHIWRHCLEIASISLVVLAALSFIGRYNMFCEILSHFTMIFFVLLLLSNTACILQKMRILAGVTGLLLIAVGVRMAPQFMPVSHARQKGPEPVSIISFNCEGKKNRDAAPIYKIACREKADIVCFSEINADWEKQINSIFTEYPYKLLFPHYGGIGLVSKFPIVKSQVVLAKLRNRPRVLTQLKLPSGQAVSIMVVHPTIPLNTVSFDGRNLDFEMYAKELAAVTTPKVLIGDLNCTPWSYYFEKLERKTGLVDATRGYGPKPTWCLRSGFIPLLPIDLCLVSPELSVSKVAVEEDAGSDHRPLLIEISVPQNL